jgi:hypothetical protein
VRNWTAEAYHAILASPPFNGVRERRARDMTIELGTLLKVFCKKDKFQWFCHNLETNCIRPAMRLYEKLQVSTHHFYLDINPYIMWGHGGELEVSPEFLDNLKNLDCKNVLMNRKAVNVAKMDPAPSKKELFHHMYNVCTVTPGRDQGAGSGAQAADACGLRTAGEEREVQRGRRAPDHWPYLLL